MFLVVVAGVMTVRMALITAAMTATVTSAGP
jgi:hypothetical protein